MARARLLHPNFFSDGDLLELSPLHRLLFAGLWGIADCKGRLDDKPIEIKIKVLPADNCDVDTMLADLHRVGRITRYEVAGTRFVQVINFLKYQHPHKNEAQSVLPEPPSGGKNKRKGASGTRVITGAAQEKDRSTPEKDRSTRAVTVTVTESVTDPVTVTDPVPPPPTSSSKVDGQKLVVVEEVWEGTTDRRGAMGSSQKVRRIASWLPTVDGTWELIQTIREFAGLSREGGRPRHFEHWAAEALRETGPAGVREAVEGFIGDPTVETPGWPTAVLITSGMWNARRPALRLVQG